MGQQKNQPDPSLDYVLHFFLSCYLSGVYEHIRNQQSLSDTYPYFDATSERNVTSFVGQVTHLHCTVKDIGDRTVSIYFLFGDTYS